MVTRITIKKPNKIESAEISEHVQCVIVDFRRGWTEFFRFLGYYAEGGCLKPTFRDYLSVLFSVKLSRKTAWALNVGL